MLDILNFDGDLGGGDVRFVASNVCCNDKNIFIAVSLLNVS